MKRLNLLLATTAMLSMGAMAVKADITNPSVSIGAEVFFTAPINVTSGNIKFGILDGSQAGSITVSPTGAVSGNAKIISGSSAAAAITPGYVDLSGGIRTITENTVNTAANFPNMQEGDEGYTEAQTAYNSVNNFVSLALSGVTFPLHRWDKEDEDYTGDLCGTVRDLQQGYPSFTRTNSSFSARVNIGGTLDFENLSLAGSTNNVKCGGSTTITFVVNDEDYF